MAPNEALVNEFLEYGKRELGLRPQTLYRYGLSYRSFLESVGGTPLHEVTADQMRVWIHVPKLKTGGGGKGAAGDPPAPATIKRRTCELRSLFAWLTDVKGLMAVNQARKIHVPTVHNDEPKPAPEEAWKRLWASDLDPSDRVAFGLAYFCGLRRHEITQLQGLHFVEVPAPRITNFARKGGKKMSLPYVSCVQFYAQRRPDLLGGSAESFLAPLGELLRDRREAPALLAWPAAVDRRERRHETPPGFVNPTSYNRRLRLALAAAGLDELEFSPHQLRHSFGTNMLAMGMDLLEVSRAMGHSSLNMTQRYVATMEDPFARRIADWAAPAETVAVVSPWAT